MKAYWIRRLINLWLISFIKKKYLTNQGNIKIYNKLIIIVIQEKYQLIIMIPVTQGDTLFKRKLEKVAKIRFKVKIHS